MEDIVYALGMIILALILYAIPILTACSFIYVWDEFFRLILIVVSMIEFGGLCALIEDTIR